MPDYTPGAGLWFMSATSRTGGVTGTALSKPFQRGVAPGTLFTPAFVAGKLAALLDQFVPDPEQSYLA
ncbi:MAG: hypothetical protein OEW92_11560, partial [Gammaproteobacteria bacterium]|nr:hypothetical protein [Gammaproteobacteria bacterium]